MITSFMLIITFCTVTTCEEYVIDHNLSRDDCKSAMMSERSSLDSIDSLTAYRQYMTKYDAESLFDVDNGVAWELSCQDAKKVK